MQLDGQLTDRGNFYYSDERNDMPSTRRTVLAALGSSGIVLTAGCVRDENQQNDEESTGTNNGDEDDEQPQSVAEDEASDEHDCDPSGDIQVFPAITVPDGESTLDAEADGLVEVDSIDGVLEQAYEADSEEFRDEINPAEQTHHDNRLVNTATGTYPTNIGVDEEEVEAKIDTGENFVHYRGRDYVLVYRVALC
ncbi:hypothetical protein G6M89_14925 [Natronolimnobius sp. AArcel1]|uniref:hypothetical protein n=1 Tax=Natronolimnobius sp. AArcel1 TaxID=1679093 RepID=UPI0013EBBFC6|nr:hypothetical protein [Natronolimnobius sp. AArcel1]NGM70286.1 hypothetical protein [Natronolimnobius sp. AArcel1]